MPEEACGSAAPFHHPSGWGFPAGHLPPCSPLVQVPPSTVGIRRGLWSHAMHLSSLISLPKTHLMFIFIFKL